jgi:hypothetical protein
MEETVGNGVSPVEETTLNCLKYKMSNKIFVAKVRFFTMSYIDIQYIGWGSKSANPYKMHCLNVNFAFNLCDVLQECNIPVKQNLTILHLLILLLQPPTVPWLLITYDTHTHTPQNVILCTNCTLPNLNLNQKDLLQFNVANRNMSLVLTNKPSLWNFMSGISGSTLH